MKHLIFDLDDTLIPSSSLYEEAYKSVGLYHNPVFSNARNKVKKLLPEGSPSSHSRILYFKIYLEMTNSFSAENLFKILNTYEDSLLEKIFEYWHKSSRNSLLSDLRKKYRLSILTNETTLMQSKKLRQIDPHADYFSAFVTSEEVGAEKPNEIIFSYIEKQIGIVDPKSVIMIGDSFSRDIEPALKRGWHAVQTNEFLQDPNQHYKAVSSLDDLPGALENL